MWTIQLIQIVLTVLSPTIFATATYNCLLASVKFSRFAADNITYNYLTGKPDYDWSEHYTALSNGPNRGNLNAMPPYVPSFPLRGITVADMFLVLFLLVYVLWSILSFNLSTGTIPEAVCWIFALYGFVVMLPIYGSLLVPLSFVRGIFRIIVVVSMATPFVLALPQSGTSAVLYFLYMPHFLVFLVFFLVFMPSYSLRC
jgi:hypothetical protein